MPGYLNIDVVCPQCQQTVELDLCVQHWGSPSSYFSAGSGSATEWYLDPKNPTATCDCGHVFTDEWVQAHYEDHIQERGAEPRDSPDY